MNPRINIKERRMKQTWKRKLQDTSTPTYITARTGKKRHHGGSDSKDNSNEEQQVPASSFPSEYPFIILSDIPTEIPSMDFSTLPSMIPSNQPVNSYVPNNAHISPSRVPTKISDIFTTTSHPSIQIPPKTSPIKEKLSQSPTRTPSVRNNGHDGSQSQGKLSPYTGLPTESPQSFTPSPVSKEATAPSKSSEASIDVKLIPFTIFYELQKQTSVTKFHFAEASEKTTAYLGAYIQNKTERFIELNVTGTDPIDSPIMITYYLVISFQGVSPIFFEVHRYIREAFSLPSVDDLLMELRSLPSTNPFSGIETVEFINPNDINRSTKNDQVLSAEILAVIISILFLFFSLCSVLAIVRWNNRKRNFQNKVATNDANRDALTRREIDQLLQFRETLYRDQNGQSENPIAFEETSLSELS